ncbi:hypothetical protein PILCRDRAFT_829298 [Piloderma croceum F 1598]|uniref:Uncharacterized protein n=1 Tax=Piloderma croceum (strain F 1598) TaxID=765440 RepID=A0A0C3AHJ5_PILCF|nr:hypothetical protein PILCRDRAFT_829298 [Piloderma croceum F 1598]
MCRTKGRSYCLATLVGLGVRDSAYYCVASNFWGHSADDWYSRSLWRVCDIQGVSTVDRTVCRTPGGRLEL